MKPFPNAYLNFQQAYEIGKQLWTLGKLLHDDPRYPKPTNWILTYRYAIRAMMARIVNVDRDYRNLNEIDGGIAPDEELTTQEDRNEWNVVWESYAGVLFFAMDSSLECFAHALNALGYLLDPSGFLDITNDDKLRRIAPSNLLDPPGRSNARRSTYGACQMSFPRICARWSADRDLVAQIMEYHDATKHRHSVVVGYALGRHLLKLAPKQAMGNVAFKESPGPDGLRALVSSDEENSLQSITSEYCIFVCELLRITREELEITFGHHLA